jgi:hypothetical protein
MDEDKGKLIKKMYRELSLKFHPDVGGDENTFKEIDDAFRSDIFDFARLYEELLGKTSGLFSKVFTEYKGKDFGKVQEGKGSRGYPLNQFGKTKYPNTVQGFVDGWADALMSKVKRIKWIDNIVVGTIEVKVYIDWVKIINGKEYEQNAYLSGKFFDYESYANAVMEAVEGSIKELK